MLKKLQIHLLIIKWLLLITLILNSIFLGMFLWTSLHKAPKPTMQICIDANNNIYASKTGCKAIINY